MGKLHDNVLEARGTIEQSADTLEESGYDILAEELRETSKLMELMMSALDSYAMASRIEDER